MGLEASEIAVRVRLLGGTAFQTEADQVAASTERMGAAGKTASAEAEANATRANAALAGTSTALTNVGSKVDSAGKKVSSASRSLLPLSLATGFGLFESSKAWTNFQKQTNLLVTQALLPRKNLQGLRKDILGVSQALRQTPTNLASGAYPIVSDITSHLGKQSNARTMQILKAAAMGANVGNDTVRNVADAISSVMASRLPGQNNPLKIIKELDATVGSAKTTMSALTQSFSTGVLPIIKTFGGGFQGALASVAALARVGVEPSSAFSRMRLTLSSVASPTVQGTNAMHSLGLDKFALSNTLRGDGLIPMIQLLQAHLKTNDKGQLTDQARNYLSEIFGKSRGTSMIASLIEQLPQIQGIQSTIQRNANGNQFEHRLALFNSSSAAKEQQLQAIWQRDLLQVGQVVNRVILPDLISMAKWLGHVVSGFSKLPKPLQDALVGLAGIVTVAAPAGLILGSAMSGIGKLISGFGTLLRWTGILASADKVAAGSEGVGGVSGAIRKGSLIPNLTRLGALAGIAGVAFAGFEAYEHRKQIGKFVSGAEKTTIAGGVYRELFGAGGVFNRDKFGEQYWKNATYDEKKYIADSVKNFKTFGENPKDLNMNALADPHFNKKFGEVIGETIAVYLKQHPNAHVAENHNHIYIDGKEVQKSVHKHDRKQHNRG